MRVPELALLGIQSLVELGGDHVLDAEDAGAGIRTIVEDTLSEVLVVEE